MNKESRLQNLRTALETNFGSELTDVSSLQDEITIEVALDKLIDTLTVLRDKPEFDFDTLIDLCGVDYLGYGESEWKTQSATSSGFTRGSSRHDLSAEKQ